MRGFGWLQWLEIRNCSPAIDSHSLTFSGDVEKAVTELIIDFDTNAEEEGPYEALYNAVSCHSLDSMASGRSSDRDSVNKETEAAGVKAAGVRPVCGLGPSPSWGLCCQPVLHWGMAEGLCSEGGSLSRGLHPASVSLWALSHLTLA